MSQNNDNDTTKHHIMYKYIYIAHALLCYSRTGGHVYNNKIANVIFMPYVFLEENANIILSLWYTPCVQLVYYICILYYVYEVQHYYISNAREYRHYRVDVIGTYAITALQIMNLRPFKWSPLAMIAPVYYACKLFGILPVSYASCGKIPYKNTVHFIGRRHENGESIIILSY
jgi:hypothetical protein